MVRTSLSVPSGKRRGRPVAGQAKCVHILAIERTPSTRSFSASSATGRWYVGPGNGLFALVQRRVRKTRSWDIDYKPERLPKRSDARIDCERVRCTRKQVPDTNAIALPMHKGI